MTMYSKNSNDDNQLIAWGEVRSGFRDFKHLGLSDTVTSNNDGPHDVYVYGTDNEGKAQAEFLNSHPKILTAFLNGLGCNITQEQLRKSSKQQFEMKIDKASWLTSQLLSWTKLMPDDVGEEARIHEYVFLPVIEQTVKQENIHATGKYAVKMVDDPDKRSPEVRMVADQIQKQIERSDFFEDKSIKARALFAISPGTDLYKFFSKFYGSQANMDQALKAADWFKPGKETHKNVNISDFCDSYWKIPEWEDCVKDTLRKTFPQGLYDKMKITIKA